MKNDKEWERYALVLAAEKIILTLEGVPCSIGGYKNDYASISADCGGFWHTSWETVERVISNGGKFIADDVTFSSGAWLGVGVEMPDALKAKALSF